MPLGYKSGSIRSGISLSDEQLNIVLQCMACAVTVRELCEESGLERHTADAIRFKVMYAIAQYQAGIKLENSAVLAFSSVKTSEKGANVCVLDRKPRLRVVYRNSTAKTFIPGALTYVKVITTTTAEGADKDELTVNEDGTYSRAVKQQMLDGKLTEPVNDKKFNDKFKAIVDKIVG